MTFLTNNIWSHKQKKNKKKNEGPHLLQHKTFELMIILAEVCSSQLHHVHYSIGPNMA